MQQYEAGMSPTKIVEEMGYDAQALGSRRVNSLYRNFQQQRVSPEGLHEGTSRSGRYRPGSTDFESAPAKHVLQLMQHELLYLRQGVEFLKKIMNADKQSREGRR